MTTVFPRTTQLSRAIAAGYPPGHSLSKGSSELASLWAFAVTSQNAVSAVEAALQHQLDAGTENRSNLSAKFYLTTSL